MGNEWKPQKLGDIFKVKHGFAFKGEYFVDEHTSDLLVTPGNFTIGGGFQNPKPKFYKGPIPEEYVLNPGDLVVTMTDLSKQSDTLGNAALIPEDRNRWLHNQRVGLIEFHDPEEHDPIFFNYLLRSNDYRHWIVGSATGTTVKHTSPGRIEEFECQIPPLPEQKRIAHILGTLDDKIDCLRRMNSTLESMAQALFKSWFVDFDPVIDNALRAGNPIPDALAQRAAIRKNVLDTNPTSTLAHNNPEIAKLFPASFQECEDLGPIPEGWEITSVKDSIPVFGGGTPSTKTPEYWDNGTIPWVTPKDFSGLKDHILLDSSRNITEAGLAKISSNKLPIGTLLMSSRAPVGYLAISKIETAINQGFIAMQPSEELTSEYLLHWAKHRIDDIQQAASGSTFAEISKKTFKTFKLAKPHPRTVHAFTKITSSSYNKITKNNLQSKVITKSRDTLIPHLLSGGN